MCNDLVAEDDIGGLEPRGTAKSLHGTDLMWEAYFREVQRRLLSETEGQREGRDGLAFHKGI